MTFQDIFKSSFLDNVNAVTVLDMVIALALAFALGLFIFFIYKRSYAGVMYSSSFGVTLIALTLITTLVILAISSNVILSLGMVGALSIVRFRTAIKEPMDIAFLFWSIAAGIVLAAGLIPLAVLGSVFIGLILLIFSDRKERGKPYILVVRCDNREAEKVAEGYIGEQVEKMSLKSKTVEAGAIELNYEVRLKDGDAAFLNELAEMPGIRHTVMVSYNGDYMG